MLVKNRVRELESHLRLTDASQPDDYNLLTFLRNEKLSLERIDFFCSTDEVLVLGEGQVS